MQDTSCKLQKMNNRILLATLAIPAVSNGVCNAAESQPKEQDKNNRPNIVIMIADDCTYRDLGCYGSKNSKTPNIDRLAQEGVRFTNFFQAAPMSSPTRHCMMTGLYPVKSGAYPNHTFAQEGVKSVVQYLRNEGYRVALQGKRHIAPKEIFDYEYLSPDNVDVDTSRIRPFIADAKAKGQPFCLFVCTHQPHTPWNKGDASKFDADKLILPSYYVDTPETREGLTRYYAEISFMDSELGSVLDMLDETGVADNTAMFFTSEQGNSLPFAKWTCYDMGLQTGMIVRWPGVTEPGSTCDAIAEYVDIVPTFIEIAGGEQPEGLDGKSFVGLLSGKEDKIKDWSFGLQTSRGIIGGPEYYGVRSVRNDRYVYIRNLTPEATFQCTTTSEKDKIWMSWVEKAKTDPKAAELVNKYQHRPAEELYDRIKDPDQRHNLIGKKKYEPVREEMAAVLESWMKSQGDLGQETEMEAKEHQASVLAKKNAKKTAKGFVFEDINGNGKKDSNEKGIPGVAVSDGMNISTTDGNGYYELKVRDHCVIFAIKPKGYISPADEYNLPQSWYIHKPAGSPQLQYKGSAPTGKLPQSLDFPMEKYDDPENFSFFAFGDPQPYSKTEVDYFRRMIVDEAKNLKGISFGISLGDVVGDKLDLHPLYREAAAGMGIPWYNVIGNHDRNYDCKEEKYANETFESNFGPSTYAFRYGDTHFIVLDDIFMNNAPKANPYKGGFSEDQFSFIENYMKLVGKDELVVLAYHIPLYYKEGQFIPEHRERLFEILKGHNVLGLSAHTHIQMQFHYGNEAGWDGPVKFHEYNVGTTNGDWYSGKTDVNGLPDATMRDGTPAGYAIINIEGNRYSFRYKVARESDDFQIRLYNPEVVPYRQGGKYPLYANFFIGDVDDTVEFRINGGEWKKMKRVTDEADPTFLKRLYEWDSADTAMKGRRPNSVPTMCTHLWKATLDNTLEPGTHSIEVRATDMFGNIHTASGSYRTEKPE